MRDPRDIRLDDGSTLHWEVTLNTDPKKIKMKLEWHKDFTEDDVSINVVVNGKPFTLISRPGESDFKAEVRVTKTF